MKANTKQVSLSNHRRLLPMLLILGSLIGSLGHAQIAGGFIPNPALVPQLLGELQEGLIASQRPVIIITDPLALVANQSNGHLLQAPIRMNSAAQVCRELVAADSVVLDSQVDLIEAAAFNEETLLWKKSSLNLVRSLTCSRGLLPSESSGSLSARGIHAASIPVQARTLKLINPKLKVGGEGRFIRPQDGEVVCQRYFSAPVVAGSIRKKDRHDEKFAIPTSEGWDVRKFNSNDALTQIECGPIQQ